MICWHFDHIVNRSIKGINLLNCLYHANEMNLPVALTKVVEMQANHIFMSLYTAARLEVLCIKQKLNTFTLKNKLYIKAIRLAFEELQILKNTAA